jgi:hypothetical protein
MSNIKGALIGTTNLKMLDKVGLGLEVEMNSDKVILSFEEVDYGLPLTKVESTGMKTYLTNGFSVLEIVTEKELYYIAVAGA